MRAVRTLFTLILFIVLSTAAFAVAPPPPTTTGGTTGTPSCWPPPCVPVDGGIGLLIAAGAAYGAKKIFEKRKKSADQA